MYKDNYFFLVSAKWKIIKMSYENPGLYSFENLQITNEDLYFTLYKFQTA